MNAYAVLTIFVVCFKFSFYTALPHQPSTKPLVRIAERDAINSAWLLSSICRPENGTRLKTPLGDSVGWSFEEIADQCRLMGQNTTLRHLNYGDLCKLETPAVVLLRHREDGGGHFAVVLEAIEGEMVTALNSGEMTIELIPEDQFRLRWTGHALLPLKQGPRPTSLLFYFLAGAIAAAVFASLFRNHRQVRKEQTNEKT